MTLPTPAAGPLVVEDRMGSLTISSVQMVCSAWQIQDLKLLWESADQRGQDRPLPGTPGYKAYRRRATLTKYALPMMIAGYFDHAGTPWSNPFIGLEMNTFYLRANVVDPTNTGDGTRPAVLTLPSGATKSGPIHVTKLSLGSQAGPIILATLNIEIPAGALS